MVCAALPAFILPEEIKRKEFSVIEKHVDEREGNSF